MRSAFPRWDETFVWGCATDSAGKSEAQNGGAWAVLVGGGERQRDGARSSPAGSDDFGDGAAGDGHGGLRTDQHGPRTAGITGGAGGGAPNGARRRPHS